MRRFVKGSVLSLAAALAVGAVACSDVTDVRLLEISATGALGGQLYLDLNRNGTLDAADEPLRQTNVTLSVVGTGATQATVRTDADGEFLFADVPAGRYTLRVDPAVLGDSLATLMTVPDFEVTLGDTLTADVGVSYPQLTLEELRAAPDGRRVFTTGIALNVRDNPTDGRVFLEGSSAYLQAVDVPRLPNIAVGDSVRILGRTGRQAGQPVLVGDSVPTVILVSRAKVPSAQAVTTGSAATAAGGVLDAALVRISAADITDTATVAGDFHFTANDGSGPLRVVLRSFLQRTTADLRPDTILRIQSATGMLSPHDDGTGQVRWRLLARTGGEVVTEERRANVGVTASVEPATAYEGQNVVFTVVVTNAGPLAATGVEVADTLPGALTRQGAVVSRGSYAASGGVAGLWTLDRIEPGRADTLRLTAQVGTGLGIVTYITRAGGLDREVDPVTDNNRATATVTRVAPPPTP